MNKVFVGTFSEDDLLKGRDKVAVQKAKEKHGLNYTNTQYVTIDGQVVGMKIWICDVDTFTL